MAESLLLYYITDRTAFPGDEAMRRHRLLEKIAEAARHGVDYIQLREKDLSTGELESLAREAIRIIGQAGKLATSHRPLTTALLINSRTDVALATAAAGVHLPANDVSPAEVRAAWQGRSGARAITHEISPQTPLVAVSCHSPEEVTQAASNSATFAVFAPVFEKKDTPAAHPTGLDALHQACRAKIPVLALGGVTLQNAESCLQAGAAGIAAIRLFQENDIATVIHQLRGH
ncbi:MAG: thiamine phosphate synthase [Candidatus Sulfotelmatobacter sp.]|jgi:thiamine-phosphate pyrophosphorylase